MRSDSGLRSLTWVLAAAMLAGLAGIFLWVPDAAPPHGQVYRILFVHAPAAWVAYLAFAVVLVASVSYLRSGARRWDLLAHSSAEVGVLFTGITLVTGMFWAKPMWGAYWVWGEPRLTLTFVLFLIYAGYLLVRALATDASRGGRIAAVIGIVGFVTIPLVHFAVDWFRGHHPGRAVINPGGDLGLDGTMLAALLLMVGVFTMLYALLLALRVRLGRLEEQAGALEMGADLPATAPLPATSR